MINVQLGGAGEKVAKDLQELTGITTRNTTLGYMQRGGTPTSYDRVLSTKYGAKDYRYEVKEHPVTELASRTHDNTTFAR